MPSSYFQRKIRKMSSEEIADFLGELEKERAEREKIKDTIQETGERVEEIQVEVQERGKEIEEIKDVLRQIKEFNKKAFDRFYHSIVPEEFTLKDLAQQIVGAMALSAPLSVTQEVWELAKIMDFSRIAIIVFLTLAFDILLFYYTKFRAVKNERLFGIIPKRILSIVIVSYLAAALMLFVFGVIGLQITDPEWQIKLVLFIGLFANIGAGAADLLK